MDMEATCVKEVIPRISASGAQRGYTIGEWADIWFNLFAKSQLSENTCEIHADARRRLTRHYPDFENKLLTELTSIEFQAILNAFTDRYSKSTITHIKSFYNSLYKYAIHNKTYTGCEVNPIGGTLIPAKASEKQVRALSRDEEKKLVSVLIRFNVFDDYCIRFFLYTGLRRAEFINLQWSDWNRKNQTIHIASSKTKHGIRDVPLIPEARAILAFLYDTNRNSLERSSYIFARKGQPVSKYHLRHICKRAAKIAGICHVTPHMLRHTFATRLLERGANIAAVSKVIGHANPAFTMRRYITPDVSYIEDQIMLLSDLQPEKYKKRA